MKRRIFLSLLIVLVLFTVTGCNKAKEKEKKKEETNTSDNDKDKLIIDGYDLTLNEESSFSKVKFKYPKDAIISNPITTLMVDYKKKDSEESLVRVLMGDMYGTNIDSSMTGFNKEGTKTINGITWTVYTDDQGRKNYGFNKNYSNVVIGFIYENPDLAKFEEEFMNNVTLLEEE